MLTTAIDAYLAMRRTLGYQLRDTEAILRDFAAFADELIVSTLKIRGQPAVDLGQQLGVGV